MFVSYNTRLLNKTYYQNLKEIQKDIKEKLNVWKQLSSQSMGLDSEKN